MSREIKSEIKKNERKEIRKQSFRELFGDGLCTVKRCLLGEKKVEKYKNQMFLLCIFHIVFQYITLTQTIQ